MPIKSTLKPVIILYLIILLITGCESNKNRHSLTDAQGNKKIETPNVEDPTPAEPSRLNQALTAFQAFNKHNTEINLTNFECASADKENSCNPHVKITNTFNITVDLPFLPNQIEFSGLDVYGDASNDVGKQYSYFQGVHTQSLYLVQPTTISVPTNAFKRHQFYLSQHEDYTTASSSSFLFIATEFDINAETNAPNSPITHQYNAYIEIKSIETDGIQYNPFVFHIQLENGSTESFKTEGLNIDKDSIFIEHKDQYLQLSDPNGTSVGYVFFKTINPVEENPDLSFIVIEFYNTDKILF